MRSRTTAVQTGVSRNTLWLKVTTNSLKAIDPTTMNKAGVFLLFSLLIAGIIILVSIVFYSDSTSFLKDFKPKRRYSNSASLSKVSDDSFTTTSAPTRTTTRQKHADYVNPKRTYKHCSIKLKWGKMCPKLYTELGGKCDLINDKFHCPDIRHYSKIRTRQAQLVLTRMLRIFDLLARKHGIKYWIARGTLLGAARHHGFIPWDGDGDIEMPLDDYVKFFQVAAKELPADIFFQNSISDPALRPSDVSGYDRHKIVFIYQATWNPRLRDKNSCYKYCIAYNCKWHDGLMVDIFVSPNVDSSIYPLKRMTFEGFPFNVQNNWKEDLISRYGEKWFEFPTNKSPDENPDVFNSCEKLLKRKQK